MDDEGIVLGTALGTEYFFHSQGIICVRRQTIDGFCGHSHNLPMIQQGGGICDVFFRRQ